jgi:UDP-N-acetyl-D-glucosamine dehydrogenase
VLARLLAKGATAVYHDPFVPEVTVDRRELASVRLDSEALREADCVIIATDHRTYEWDEVVTHARLIVDTRNVTARLDRHSATSGARIVRLGAGTRAAI